MRSLQLAELFLLRTGIRIARTLGPLAERIHRVSEDAAKDEHRDTAAKDKERVFVHSLALRDPARISAPSERIDGTQIPT